MQFRRPCRGCYPNQKSIPQIVMENNYSDDVRQHLSFIQGVIARMNSNSFSMKGWMVALVSALCAVYAGNASAPCGQNFFIVAIVVTIIFWCLDSYYLRMERQYRDLYSHVLEDKVDTDFNMNASGFNQSYLKAMWWSWSTTPLYLSVIALLCIAICLITN